MNSSVNETQLIGIVGQPELSYLPSGLAKFVLGVKTTDVKPGRDGEKTEYIDVWINNLVAFGKLAENMNRLCTPGTKILVRAKFKPEKWEDKDGNKRSSYSFIINEFVVLAKSKKTGEPSDDLVPETAAVDEEFPF